MKNKTIAVLCNPLLCCTTNAFLPYVASTNQPAPTHAFEDQAKNLQKNYAILPQLEICESQKECEKPE